MPDCATRPTVRIEDFERVEDYLRAYLEDERFASRYPSALDCWSDAWAMLWRADTRAKVIAATHEGCEAVREFACALAEWHVPHTARPKAAETLTRLSALVEMYRPQLGDDRCDLLQALFDYWEALCKVVQRHEDRAQRITERLRWEDGRRVVVLAALLMIELDRSI